MFSEIDSVTEEEAYQIIGRYAVTSPLREEFFESLAEC